MTEIEEMIEEIDKAIREVRQGQSPSGVQLLVKSSSPTVEPALFEILSDRQAEPAVTALVVRILVERDVDRDPSFLEDYLPKVDRAGRPSSGLIGVLSGNIPYPPPGAHALGFARLRRCDPVRVYSDQLKHDFFGVRLGAAAALGDTADLAALEPLARALSDSSWRVRVNAADSVRRLRHVGAAEVLAGHPVRDGLIKCLSDGRRRVRVAAARALGSMGDLEPVRKRRARSLRSRREFGRVLRGEIPPLPKIWAGDDTV